MVRIRNNAFGLAARLLTGLVACVLLFAALPARAQTIGFAFATTSVSEGATNAVLVVSRSPANGAASVLFSTADGNAANGTDFIGTNGVLSFVNGEASKLISIGILSDTLPEPPKSFFVILSDPIGGVLGISTNVVTILDDDSLYSFSALAYRVDEGASNLVVTVIRGGGTFGAGTVEVTTSDGTNASPALSGVNYVATRAIVSFTNGQASATVNIPIIDNLITETNLSFFVALGNPVSGSISSPATATVTITDNDPAGGTLEFIYPPPIPVFEGFGTVIAVARRGGSAGVAAVDYRQINRGNSVTNATPLIDYTGDSGTLTWADGDSAPKFITLTMLNDANVELDETAVIGLFNATNAAINLSRSTMPVIILSSDQAPGSAERGYNVGIGANNTVYALAVNNLPGDPNNGRTIIAGDFTAVNGVPITRIARVLQSGSLDPSFNPGTGPDGYVAAVALQPDGAVVLGGGFTSVNGTNWNGIGRLLPNGALDSTFHPGDGANGPVNVIALQPDGKILIGGEFTAFDHVARNRLARLNADGSLDSTFNPGVGANATVHALDVQADGKILVGGRFTSFNTGTLPYLVRLNPDGSTDATFAPLSGPDAPVFAVLAQASGAIYVGGSFRIFDGLDRSGVVRLAANGLVDATFNPGTGVNGSVYAMRVEPGGLALIAGDFNQFNGTARTNLARLNADGTLDTSFMDLYYNQTAPGPNAFVLALDLEAGGNLMLGGGFTAIGGGNSPQDVRPRLYFGRVVGGPMAPLLNNPGNVEFVQSAYTVNENDSRTFVTIQARRLHGNLGPFIADYATVDGTAVAGRDYIAGQGTVSWADGDPLAQLVTIQISLIDNAVIDGNRTFSVVLSNPRNLSPRPTTQPALGFTSTTEVTIVDDDFNRGVLGFSSAVYEVLEGAGTATITVVRTNGSAGAVSVQYTTANGSAIATVGPVQGDYTTAAGTLTFVSGQTNASFTVRITDDTVVEFDETVNLRLFNVSGGATLGLSNATLVIFDNENPALNPGSLSFASATYSVAEGATNALITVRRTSGSAGAVTVDAMTYDFPAGPGFARAGSDYTATTNRLVFGAGVTSQSFVVPVYQDPFVEGDEVLGLQLVNPLGGARLGFLTNATLTIVDDDSYGAISFSTANYYVNETAGSVAIAITRTGGSSQPVSVDFRTAPLTAIPGTDYLDVISTLNFADGETNKVVTIPVLNNDLVQNNKTVALTLANLLKATPGRFMQATLTIFDDESLAAPAGTVDPSFVPVPGFNGPVNALALHRNNALLVGGGFSTFNGQAVGPLVRLTLSGLLDTTFASRVGTDGDVRALAVQNDGRIVVGGGFLNFNGISRRSITRLNDDGTTDTTFAPGAGADNPVFAVAVRAGGRIVVGGSFVTFNGVPRPNVALLNADGSVDSSFNTGVGPNGPVYAVGVQFDGKVVIAGDFTMVNNVARARVARLNANGSLDLTFDPGTGPDSGVRALLVLGDRRIAVGGSFATVAGAARPGIALLNTNGVVDAAFNPGTGADAVVLGLAQEPSSRLLAVGNFTQYQGVTRRGVVRINLDGSVDSSINFGAGADNFVAAVVTQPDQQIVVGGGFTQFDGRPRGGIARVLGGENFGGGEFELGAASYSVSEAGGQAVIDVRRRGGLFGAASVNYTITPGTGAAGVDYVAANGTLNFPAGEALGSFTLQILNNTNVNDGDRTVLLALNTNAPASGAGLGAVRAAVLTILNDDQSVGFVTANYSVNENAISGRASILVQRTGGTSDSLFVDYATTTNGTATPFLDFTPTSGTLVFNPGETAVAFSVAIINDSLVESDETIGLLLTNAVVPANSTATIALGLTSATLTIIDNEFGPGSFQFATNSFIVSESVGSAAVVIQRVNGSGGIATVRFAASNGTATNGLDYIATNGVLTFAAGEISKTVLVRVLNDALVDGDKTVNLALSAATGAGIIGSNAVLTIVDDDSILSLSAPAYSIDEAAGVLPVTVLRTGATNVQVSVVLTTSDGTALAGTHYLSVSNVLVFLPGITTLTVPVPILDNTNIAANPTFNVALSGVVSTPTGTSVLGESNAVVTIIENDAGLRFSALNYNVREDAGRLAITVLRTGRLDSTVAIDYATSNLTAVAGLHYVAVSGTLVFAPGVTSRTFDVPLIDNTITNADRTVLLALRNPVGPLGTMLINPVTATLTILDNEALGAVAGSVDPTFNYGLGANGPVNALTFATNGLLVVGGDFSTLNGARVNRVGRLNVNGTVDASFNPGLGPNGVVFGVAVQEQRTNAVIVGGAFSSVNGTNAPFLARLRGDGSLDTAFAANSAPDNSVFAVAVQPDGAVVFGGAFTTVGGTNLARIARVDVDGALDATFNPGTGANGIIRAIAVQPDGRILIGGDFTSYNGTNINRIARLNTDGSLDNTFLPGFGADGSVQSLVVTTNGTIVVGGAFVTFNGFTRNGITQLNPDGSLDAGFNAGVGANGPVNAIGLRSDAKLIVVGDFTGFNDLPLVRVARLNDDGSVDDTFEPGSGPDNAVNAVAQFTQTAPPVIPIAAAGGGIGSNTNAVDTGSTSGVLTLTINTLVIADSLRIYYDGGLLLDTNFAGVRVFTVPYGPGTSTVVTVIMNEGNPRGSIWNYTGSLAPAAAGANVDRSVIGGLFRNYNGEPHDRLALLTGTGVADPAYGVGQGAGAITSVAINTNAAQPDLLGKLVIGGAFNFHNGVALPHLARLNQDGTVDLNFNTGGGLNAGVNAVAVQGDGRVVAGGYFSFANGVSRNAIARFNTDGSLDATFDPGVGANNPVFAVALQADGRALIGGLFTVVNTTARNYIARLNLDGTVDASFNPGTGANDSVRAIAVQPDGRIIIAGEFTSIAGTPRNRLARLNANGTLDGSFNPAGLLDGSVNVVLIDAAGGIVVGGSFTAAGGSSRSYLARFTSSGALDATFNTAGGPDDFVATLSRQTDGKLIVGGGFTSVGGLARRHLARLNADGSVDPTINFGVGANDAVLASLVQFYDGRVVVGGAFTAFEGVPVPHLVRLNGGNNSGAGTLSFELSAYSVSESAGTNAVLTVLRAGGLNGPLTGQLSVTGGTAVNGTDFVFSSPLPLNFAAGQSVLNIPVPILDTPGVNADRTINFAVVAAGQTNTTTLTIRDNDTELVFSVASYSVVENAGTALITVVRRGGTANAYSVQYGMVDATAVAGVDYTNTTGVLNWADGDATAKTFTVGIINNAATNSPRALNLVLFGATNQTLGTPAVLTGQTNATLAIVDDEFGPGEFRFSAPTYTVLENAGTFTVTVVRTNGSAGAVAVRYGTANGTALAGTNYVATSGILIFAAGETVKSFNIPLINDAVANGNRTVALSLNSPLGGARIIQTNAVLTILDDDLPGGAVDLTFASGSGFDGAVLALAQPRDGGLLVAGDFTTYNGATNVIRLTRLTTDGLLNTNFNAGTNLNAAVTALALRPDGRLVAGGQFTNFFAINAAGPVSYLAGLDTNGAVDAAFNVGTGPNNVVFALALQPDGKLLVGGQFTAINGTNRTFLARLLPDGGVDPSFNPLLAPNQPVRAIAVDALGRIVFGGDFTSINGLNHGYLARVDTNGVLDAGFNTDANGPVYALTVQPDGKILVGGDFAAINATPMGSLARLNADGTLDPAFTPGTGANDFISLIVLQADGRILVGGGFNLFNGAGQNFVARLTPNGVLDATINFGTGADNFVAAAAVQPDGKIVLGGGFTVFNGVPQNRITRVSGRSNLDAGLVVYSATNYFVAENTRAVDITLLRLGGLNGALTVTNVSGAGGLNPARPGVDFLAATNVFTFADGQATTNFAIAIFDTPGTNVDRTVALGLSGAVGATAGAQVTIVDNDAFPSFSATNGLVTSFSVAENAGQAVITVLRVGGAANAISVGYSATNGTAFDNKDFFQTNGVLTWADGDVSPKTFLVTVRDNKVLDGARTVNLSLFNPSNLTMQTTIPGFLQNTAVLTIFDNEALPGQLTWSTNLYLVNENAGFVDLPIRRVGGSAGIVSVNVSTADDTALFGNDYTRFNAVVVFADGETNKVVRIGIVADAIPEGDEQFRVLLSNPAGGATLGAVANAVVVIADNVVSFASAAYTANEAGGQASIRLIRPVSSLGALTVDVVTEVLGVGPGFAAPGLDYLAVTGTVTFASGETSQNFVVPLVDDQVFRGTRTLGLRLLNPAAGATIGIGAAVLTITDNDVPTSLYSFTNAARISIFNTTDLGAATNQARSPYPSVIPVAGVTGQVVRVAVTLRDFMTTNRPADVDVLLQGPGGQSVVLMAGAGTNIPVASATLGFDDAALDLLPASTALTNRVYRPTLLPGGTVSFPTPAPVSPQGNTFLGVFNSLVPNGDWKLFVKSRGGSLEAFVLAGWQLDFTTVVPAQTNNLSLTMSDTVDPVSQDGVVTYLISVENLGPNTANNVSVFDTFPAQLEFASGFASQGRISNSNGLVIVNFGSISNGSVATVLLAARAVVPGVFTNYATAVGGDAEINPADNSAAEVTTVVPGAVSSGGTIPLGITPTQDATLLADTLTGGSSAGLTVRSATLQGHTNAATGATSSGLFNFGPPPALFGLPAPGIVLSTGNVLDYGVGTNSSPTNTTDFGVAATAAQQLLLNPITRPNAHFDVTQLDIRFAVQPGFNQVTFNLVFGSEEWPTFVGFFNDGFGIFLNGTNIAFTAGRAVNIDHPSMVSNTFPNELNGILAPGNNPVLSFTAPVVPGSTNNVLTFIIADTLDGLLDSTVYVSSLRALQAPNADLAVRVSAVPVPVFVGSNLSYSITVNNLGPNVAPNAVLRDVLPPEFHLLSATTSQGILSVSNSTLICSLGNLGPNGFALINVVGTVVAEGLLTNLATVASDLPDFATANNFAMDVITAFPFSGYNPNPVTIADAGPALLYPSVVNISGFGGLVDKVTVTLTNLNHANVADIDLLLVGPQGQKVLLMSDVGLLGSVTNANLTFDDDATNSLPQTGSVVSGRYRPTNFGTGDGFYPPAPSGPYATTLAAFTGTDPNGDWKLFIVDDSGRDLGELTGGWRLTFVSPPPPTPVPALRQPRRVGNSLAFSWPLGAFGYVLESTTMMGPGAVWVPEGQVPTTDGINNQVTVPIGNGLKFFRLRKP